MSRVLSAKEMDDLLLQAKVGRLGLSYRDDPYVIPLCFVYYQDAFYFHCSPKGKKIDYLSNNSRACYQVDQVGDIISTDRPCKYNISFRSVLAEGVISIVTDDTEKFTALQQLVKKYAGLPIAEKLTPEDLRTVNVLKLTVNNRSGCAVE